MSPLIIGILILVGLAAIVIVSALSFREVVPTNSVDIVQSSKQTVSYGKDQTAGNTYYKWPSWVPVIGIKTISLPVSVFDVKLGDYAGYDKGRVPFKIDIMAFFRITDSNLAAQRISSFEELHQQLQSILQGAVRTILASNEIEQILEGRAEFGIQFTKEVDHQLEQWGVQSVKCIELMDIRDSEGSKVISNIMEKKKSFIEMESRTEVAANKRKAEIAEIEAAREVGLQQQEAAQQIGIRTAEKDQQVGIAKEKSQQIIKEQAQLTAKKELEIVRTNQVTQAEIEKESKIIEAEQWRQQQIITAQAEQQKVLIAAEAEQKRTVILAEAKKQEIEQIASGRLSESLKAAEGLQAQGLAKAESEKAFQLASVTAQTELANSIGANQGYQLYLVEIRKVEKDEKVGIEQAKALQAANIKVISNAGDISSGISNIGELLSSKGGTKLGAMVEAFGQTEAGEKLLANVTK